MTSTDLRTVLPDPEALNGFQRLMSHCGWVDLSHRDQIELTGRDRQSFLHNLCTNDIKRLAAGQGCEAFVTSVQGKCLGYIHAFASSDALVVETAPGQSRTLLDHWDRYLITEEVGMIDRSQDWGQILLAGPRAPDLLQGAIQGALPTSDWDHVADAIADVSVWIRRVKMTREPSWLIACARGNLATIKKYLTQADAADCSEAAFQMARLEQGFPWYGWDITEKNLPQEVGRDSSAISFTKGCYLGQETVARIDALGHVNRTLIGMQIHQTTVPNDGDRILHEDQAVGEVTSAAFSPSLGTPIAMGYVRRTSSAVGTSLRIGPNSVEVVALPIS